MIGEALIEEREDGSRLMGRSNGDLWVERSIPGSTAVSRTYISTRARYAMVMPEDRFRIHDSIEHGSSTAVLEPPAPPKQRKRKPEPVRVEPETPAAAPVAAPTKVRMTHRARRKLDAEIEYGLGAEVGGGLYGWVDGDTIVIEDVAASPGNRFGDGDSGSVRINIEGLVAIERDHLETTGYCLVGDVHSHENWREGRNWKASDADLQCWARELSRTSRIGAYVGLIMSPAGSMEMETRWHYPRFTCHIVSTGGDGKPTVAATEMEVELDPETTTMGGRGRRR